MTVPCGHLDFEAEVNIDRICDEQSGDVVGFYATVRIRCKDCRVRFRFHGLPVGLMPDRPMTDPSGHELRAPISPDAHTTSLMAGLPGFAMRAPEDEEEEETMPNIPYEYDPPWTREHQLWCDACERHFSSDDPDYSEEGAPGEMCSECQLEWLDKRKEEDR